MRVACRGGLDELKIKNGRPPFQRTAIFIADAGKLDHAGGFGVIGVELGDLNLFG
jgi:hypothetical protein